MVGGVAVGFARSNYKVLETTLGRNGDLRGRVAVLQSRALGSAMSSILFQDQFRVIEVTKKFDKGARFLPCRSHFSQHSFLTFASAATLLFACCSRAPQMPAR